MPGTFAPGISPVRMSLIEATSRAGLDKELQQREQRGVRAGEVQRHQVFAERRARRVDHLVFADREADSAGVHRHASAKEATAGIGEVARVEHLVDLVLMLAFSG